MGRPAPTSPSEAADLVLADDNFASILAAVEEGRAIFANIRKVALYLLAGGLGLLLTILSSVFLGLPLPFTPTMILWVNFVTSGSRTWRSPSNRPRPGCSSGRRAARTRVS